MLSGHRAGKRPEHGRTCPRWHLQLGRSRLRRGLVPADARAGRSPAVVRRALRRRRAELVVLRRPGPPARRPLGRRDAGRLHVRRQAAPPALAPRRRDGLAAARPARARPHQRARAGGPHRGAGSGTDRPDGRGARAAAAGRQARCAAAPALSLLRPGAPRAGRARSEEHTSELQSHSDLVCRLLLEKKYVFDERAFAGRRQANVDLFFFFNDTATTEIYTLSLHDALPMLTSWPS